MHLDWSGRRRRIGGRAGAALLGVLALALAACGGGGQAAVSVVAATAAVTPTAIATAPPTATATETPTATPTAEPTEKPGSAVVTSLEQLKAKHGEPPGATYGRMRIPALGVDAPVDVRRVGADGVMANPVGPSDVVWYDFAGWQNYGGAPGGGRNAIFSGHVDYAAYVPYADVNYRGTGVFFRVGLLSPGDRVEVQVGGQTLIYAVRWRREVPADGGDWADLFNGDPGEDRITMITCSGEFNYTTRNYVSRTVVRAVRVG